MQGELYDPTWVQQGELGIAFVALLALLSFMVYVLRTSHKREERLMAFMERVAPTLESIDDRLTHLEQTVGVKEKRPVRPRSKGLGLSP